MFCRHTSKNLVILFFISMILFLISNNNHAYCKSVAYTNLEKYAYMKVLDLVEIVEKSKSDIKADFLCTKKVKEIADKMDKTTEQLLDSQLKSVQLKEKVNGKYIYEIVLDSGYVDCGFFVDWGDGLTDRISTEHKSESYKITHNYDEKGNYIVNVYGSKTNLRTGDCEKDDSDLIGWTSLHPGFENNTPKSALEKAKKMMKSNVSDYKKIVPFFNYVISKSNDKDLIQEALYNRARCYHYMKQYQKSLDDFHLLAHADWKSSFLKPGQQGKYKEFATYELGVVSKEMGNIELARHYYELTIEKYPDSTYANYARKNLNDIDTATASAEPDSGESWTESTTGMEFAWVPGGCYQMGCGSWTDNCDDDEKPVHEVCVDGFWMGRHEVTIDQYREFLQDTGDTDGVDWDHKGCPIEKGGSYSLSRNRFGKHGSQPMVTVSWHGAKAFAEWLSEKTDKKFRLPTEAEWEYAARSGGKKENYAGGDNMDRVAWHNYNSEVRSHRVGKKAPNGLGLYDMSGNVEEWCADWYAKDAYEEHSRNNPIYDSGGVNLVIRGGSYFHPPTGVRCANRSRYEPGGTSRIVGFRLLRTK